MPDPGDFEPDDEESKKQSYKTNNFHKGDNVGLQRFSERFEKTKLRDPKTSQYIEKE